MPRLARHHNTQTATYMYVYKENRKYPLRCGCEYTRSKRMNTQKKKQIIITTCPSERLPREKKNMWYRIVRQKHIYIYRRNPCSNKMSFKKKKTKQVYPAIIYEQIEYKSSEYICRNDEFKYLALVTARLIII